MQLKEELKTRIKNKTTFIIDWTAIIILPGIICLLLIHKLEFVNVDLPFLSIFVPNISSIIQCIIKPSGYLGLGNSLNDIKANCTFFSKITFLEKSSPKLFRKMPRFSPIF
jgi:hypothetical protein